MPSSSIEHNAGIIWAYLCPVPSAHAQFPCKDDRTRQRRCSSTSKSLKSLDLPLSPAVFMILYQNYMCEHNELLMEHNDLFCGA